MTLNCNTTTQYSPKTRGDRSTTRSRPYRFLPGSLTRWYFWPNRWDILWEYSPQFDAWGKIIYKLLCLFDMKWWSICNLPSTGSGDVRGSTATADNPTELLNIEHNPERVSNDENGGNAKEHVCLSMFCPHLQALILGSIPTWCWGNHIAVVWYIIVSYVGPVWWTHQ